MNQSELVETVHASKTATWEVLYRQYGDIHIHNPTMQSSCYLDGASKGELGSVRRCMFTDKLFVEEKIAEVEGEDRFTVEVTEHNLPFIKKMSAIYELSSIDSETTKITMTSFNSFSPGFMKYLMRGSLRKSLGQHLFGLKYYLETGKIVNADNYSEVFKSYSGAAR